MAEALNPPLTVSQVLREKLVGQLGSINGVVVSEVLPMGILYHPISAALRPDHSFFNYSRHIAERQELFLPGRDEFTSLLLGIACWHFVPWLSAAQLGPAHRPEIPGLPQHALSDGLSTVPLIFYHRRTPVPSP